MGTENKIKIIHIVAHRYFLLEALYLDDIGIKFRMLEDSKRGGFANFM